MSRRPSLQRNAPALTLSNLPTTIASSSSVPSPTPPALTSSTSMSSTLSSSSISSGSSVPTLTFSSSPSPTSFNNSTSSMDGTISTPEKPRMRLASLPELELPRQSAPRPSFSFSSSSWGSSGKTTDPLGLGVNMGTGIPAASDMGIFGVGAAQKTWGNVQVGLPEDIVMDSMGGMQDGRYGYARWEVDADGDALMMDAF